MKRVITLLLALVMVLSLAACGAGGADNKTVSGTLPEIVDRIYENADLDAETRDFVDSDIYGPVTMEIDAESMVYYFGVDIPDAEEAVFSEPMMNAKAFSVCLVRVKDGTDVEALKADIKANADPRKWICVGVEDSDVRVESIGNVVLLVMAENSEKYTESFLSLAE
ncbi:MAG: DUF4358 domain-containing protein [Clostridia bacterium]|nr:DUF4358 domain-containing protein [Clostridia bacterium]